MEINKNESIEKTIKKEKKEKFELKLYEKLGVLQFRKMVFLLEKVIHKKDKGKNTNYHMNMNEINAIENFKKYLFYNGSIHVRNIIRLSFFFLVEILAILGINVLGINTASNIINIYPSALVLANACAGFFWVKDAYCIMLQRYNYIRSNETSRVKKLHEDNKIDKKVAKFEREEKGKDLIKSLSDMEKEELVEMINNLKLFLENKKNLYIGNSELEKLGKISELLKIYNEFKGTENIPIEEASDSQLQLVR